MPDRRCAAHFRLNGERLTCARIAGHPGHHEGTHSHGTFRWMPVGPPPSTAVVHLARRDEDVPALPAPTSIACRQRLEHEHGPFRCTRPAGHDGLHVTHSQDELSRHTIRAIWEASP